MVLALTRFAAAVAAFMLSREQHRFFDCNKLPVLSVLSGTITLLLVYALAEVLVRVITTSSVPTTDKPAAATKVVLIGGVAVAVAGFCTMMTHLCP